MATVRGRLLRGRALFGSRPLTPVSRQYGFDRGTPIDRHYIEHFLARHGHQPGYSGGCIRGKVLEFGSDAYVRRFGHALETVDVMNAVDGNPSATLVGDLASGEGVPVERYDCIVCTQTLHVIYDMGGAVATLHRALRPGGVVLATVPGITSTARPDRDHWGDYWRLTTASARRLFEEAFLAGEVHVEAYGNLAAATAFLHGLAAEELRPAELDLRDPDYETLVAVRARKAD